VELIELTTAKASKYKLWMSRPNVHIGLHYGDVIDEYGLVSIAMVIVFELKHKFVDFPASVVASGIGMPRLL
jgi:hypothetical protein